jgi:hypothetical protein
MNSRFLILLTIIGLQLSASLAQQMPLPSTTTSHAILGTVLDPSGAVIPRAQVALTRLDGTRIADTLTVKTLHFDSETGMPQYDPVARKIYVNLQDQNVFAVIDPVADEVIGRYSVGAAKEITA